MQIKIEDLREKLQGSLIYRGLSLQEAEIVAEPFIEAELRGKKGHGIGKFFLIEEAIKLREGRPEIVKDKYNYALIDGHKELGYITAQFATDILIAKVKEFDNAHVGIQNSYYFSMTGIYARKVAKAGFVAIILSNGGRQGTAPYGGIDALFGTNPIAIGIPTESDPIVLDMGTSKRTWGEINLAKAAGKSLPENTYLDIEGNFTTDPHKVNAIVPFGEQKGYGLNFMFEILTGAFVGAQMGLVSKNAYDQGFFFMAFSPEMFGTREDFNTKVKQLVSEIKNSQKMKGFEEIYLPGEQSDKRLRELQEKGYVDIDESIWNKLNLFAQGEDIKSNNNLIE